MSDWDAARYHRISDPQLVWGRTVLARLMPAAGERILDIGCGTGRLTSELAAAPGMFIVGLDRSPAMLREAAGARRGQTPAVNQYTFAPPASSSMAALERGISSKTLQDSADHRSAVQAQAPPEGGRTPGESRARIVFVQGDGGALPFRETFDAVFSAAAFHWIPDHDRVFRSIYGVLRRGGRLVAQAGGAGNLELLYGRTRRLMRSPRYERFFASWSDPCHFENVEDTESRLRRAGFVDIDVSLAVAPVPFQNAERYAEFVAAVCLRHQLDRLPEDERSVFIEDLTQQAMRDEPPLTLDYWRLNIAARKPAA